MQTEFNRVYRNISQAAALTVAGIGAAVLLGWVLNIPALKSVLPELAPMKANSALGFVLAGASLTLFHRQRKSARRAAVGMAGLLSLWGFLHLSQYAFGMSLGIDEMLFAAPATAPFPGRPSAMTAFNLGLSGIALMLLTGTQRHRLSQLLGIVIGSIGLVGTLGYVYGVRSLYAVPAYSSMALHTAVSFFILSVGIVLAQPEHGFTQVFADRSAGGIIARRLLPAAVFIPAGLGWLVLTGQNASLYDSTFRLALMAVSLAAVFTGVIWWTAAAISQAERERQAAQVEKARADEQLRVIFEEAPDVIALIEGSTGNILKINRIVKRLLGYDRDGLIGRPFATLFPPEEAPSRSEIIRRIQTSGAVFLSQTFKCADGTTCVMDLTASLIPWGSDRAIVVTLRDASERIRLEEQSLNAERLRIDLEKERELLQAREEFIAHVSHDFRTPLTVIMSSNEILERYHDRLTDDRRAEHQHRIREQVSYLKNMLDDVIALRQAKSRKIPFSPAAIDLETFCLNLFEQVRATSNGGHHFIFRTEGRFDDVLMDEKLLHRILLNLLSNAVKYSPDGGEIRFEVLRREEEAFDVVFQISDQGIGIPQNDQAQLFEAYYKASNTGQIPGTGLGLAIVYENVKNHGGVVELDSIEGQGTTFRVRLPGR